MSEREIKFRVWTGNTMEYNVIVGKFGAFFVNPTKNGDGLDEKDGASLTVFNTIYGKETSIMQFTGLLDKNSKEIYEGDLLKDFDFPVTFEEGCFWAIMAYDLTRVPLYELDLKETEIIGNIYDNPD